MQCGFDHKARGAAEEWRWAEKMRRIKMEGRLQTREQRMAILGMQGWVMASDLFQMYSRCCQGYIFIVIVLVYVMETWVRILFVSGLKTQHLRIGQSERVGEWL